MGCDIHGVLQTRRSPTEAWRTECEIEDSRRYILFAILAGVRNGFGFAGVPTHDPVSPIQEQRGLPDDFKVDGEDHVYGWDDEKRIWMGDHSHGWVTLKEVLEWPHWDTGTVHTGILSRDEYAAWDKVSQPAHWCGGISGRDVVVTDDPQDPGAWTHIQVSWKETPRNRCRLFWKWLDYVQARYSDEEVRLVFGFDS